MASRNGFVVGNDKDSRLGWGLDLRAGLALLQKPHNDLTLSAEVIPSWYRDGDVQTHATGLAFVAAWKWY